MRHTVEIADTDGKTIKIALAVDNIGDGGSWRTIDKGGIRHNSGSLHQYWTSWSPITHVRLVAGGAAGIELRDFISWGTVNDEGEGTLAQPWVLSLKPGAIEWSIV